MKSRRPERVQAAKTRSKKRVEKRLERQSRNTMRVAELKQTRQKVDEFAKTHPGFDRLSEEIIFWIKKKLKLNDAYLVASTLDKLKVKVGGQQ